MPGVLAGDGVKRLARALAALLAIAWLAAACAQSASDADAALAVSEWEAIKGVIGDQLDAFRAGDGETAFGYASPGIRAQFVDAPTFIAMVRNGYSALLTARYTEFLEGAVIDGQVIQPLRVVGRDNSVVVALYTMERHEGRWKIAGCVLAPSTVKAAAVSETDTRAAHPSRPAAGA
jgi:hypothetical protein